MAAESVRLRPRPTRDASEVRSLRDRRKRPVVSYEERSTDSSESDTFSNEDGKIISPNVPRSSARRALRRVSYREDSAETGDFEVTQNPDESIAPTRTSRADKSRVSVAQIQKSTNSTGSKRRKARPPNGKSRTIGAKRQRNSIHRSPQKPQEIPHDASMWPGKAMPWTNLPYHVWASIFSYASYPLVTITFDPLPSITWLVHMALVCKAFMEPALSALYYEPPIHEASQIPKFISLLESQNEKSSINYRAKIKRLSVDSMISPILRRNLFDNIIPHVSQLRSIALGVHSDDPKLCRMHTKAPIARVGDHMYMFSVLESAQTKLENWTWNRTMDSHFLPISSLKNVHRSTPFQSLTSLTFIDFHLPAKIEYNGQEISGEEALADTLNVLPSLRSLRFSLADVVNDRLMPLLPDNLQTLILTSCYNLFSPALVEFLLTKGQHLKELDLSHNQSLSLSYLTELSTACPQLEILKMNLLYYNSHTTFSDSAPRYESLLSEGEQPWWPKTLRHLELLQLRKWKAPAAELFFSSFVDSPGGLPDLRHMEIKASIDESGWRERIAFRDKWVHRLKEVFLRKSPPPTSHLSSFAAFREWKSSQTNSAKDDARNFHNRSEQQRLVSNSKNSDVPAAGKRRRSSDLSGSDAPLVNVRRSARTKPSNESAKNESNDSRMDVSSQHHRRGRRGQDDFAHETDQTGVRSGRSGTASQAPPYVQGLCNVVDIVIDNLRPAEEQLHESDFLDDERSGDEDWNGDNDMDDGRYAW